MIQIPRFEIVDVDYKRTNKIGIKDHAVDKLVVALNEIVDKQTTLSIAEDFISVIENHLENGDDSNGSED